MAWVIWLAGAAGFFLIGAYLFRTSKVRIARLYVIACAVLLTLSFTNFVWPTGLEAASWSWTILGMLVPGTLVLMAWEVERDRKAVVGAHRGRDETTSLAYLHGAGGGTEGGF